MVYAPAVKVVILTGADGNFSSGGDVHEIIGPLTAMAMPELLAFTRMTGDLVKAIRACPQPVICALDGVCVGADRKSVVQGKSVSVRVDIGGGRLIKKKKKKN